MEQADLFLRWLSERGWGAWEALRDATRWLFGDALPGGRWWVVADQLADLGHIDIDRDEKRWSAAPAVINYLPPRSMLSVLCGSRTRDIAEKIERLADAEEGPDVAFAEIAQQNGPSVWVFAGTREETAAFAALAGLPFVDDAADRIANRLAPISSLLGPGSYVRGGSDGILAFDADDLGFRLARDPGRPGLYKIAGAGGPRFVYSPRPGYYHNVDPRLGTYLELSRQARSVIRYSRGDMWVPRWLPLPDPHRRCLTLCTGFLPGEEGEFLRYEAVPEIIADKVARSLGQRPIAVVPARH